MTSTEKRETVRTFTNEELLGQLDWIASALEVGSIETKMEARENLGIVKAELIARLNK